MGQPFNRKLSQSDRDTLARIGNKTIKPEQRQEKEPKGSPNLPIRDETNK